MQLLRRAFSRIGLRRSERRTDRQDAAETVARDERGDDILPVNPYVTFPIAGGGWGY